MSLLTFLGKSFLWAGGVVAITVALQTFAAPEQPLRPGPVKRWGQLVLASTASHRPAGLVEPASALEQRHPG